MTSVVGDSLDVELFIDVVAVVAVIDVPEVEDAVDVWIVVGVGVPEVIGIMLLSEVLPEVVVTSLYRPSNGNGIVFSQTANTSLQYFSFWGQ